MTLQIEIKGYSMMGFNKFLFFIFINILVVILCLELGAKHILSYEIV